METLSSIAQRTSELEAEELRTEESRQAYYAKRNKEERDSEDEDDITDREKERRVEVKNTKLSRERYYKKRQQHFRKHEMRRF